MANRKALGGTLVLGGGFAGGYVARLLGKRGATIVSPENFMLYTPMLPEAASGTLEPRHVVVPLRQMCPHAELLLGRATEVDTDRREVAVETENGMLTVSYDELVVALGAISRALRSPGSPTMPSVSSPSPTRSSSATMSCAGSRRPTRPRARSSETAS